MPAFFTCLVVAALAAIGLLPQAAAADLPAEAEQLVSSAKADFEAIKHRVESEERQRAIRLGAQLGELARQMRAQGRTADADTIDRYIAAEERPRVPPTTAAVNKKCEVEWHGTWYPAILLKQEGNRFYIQYDGYGEEWNEWVEPERIRGIEVKEAKPAPLAVGSAVEILWGGRWWPGQLLKIENGKYHIRYDNYGDHWNEWIGDDRIRPLGQPVPQGDYTIGSKVEILWGGVWWPGEILKSDSGRYFIHYDNHTDTWDEWVGPDRLRHRQAAATLPKRRPDTLEDAWPMQTLGPYDGRPAIEYARASGF